jgi:alpha-amylase
MKNRLILGSLLVALLVLGIAGLSKQNGMPAQDISNSTRTAFVHLFEWKWDDIAQECETFLGPKGFTAVQISPPNEHAVLPTEHFPWWQRYQPVSYKLQSRSGTASQLIHMIQRCHQAGVKIYADAVINHMAAQDKGTGSAGTRYHKYHYPQLYQPSDFHPCRHNIFNYGDRDQVLNCQLVGLPDLNTSSPYVQSKIVDYLKTLIHVGVDGFRIDAAKHINAKDLGAILSQFRHAILSDPYIYQEVIDPGNEAIKKTEYYSNGNVIEFEYGRQVGAKFLERNGQTIAQLETLGESWRLAPSEKAVVFIDNHDKQRGHGGGGTYITYKDGRLYDLANIFMLAFPYGYPQIMSSYDFSTPDQGPPADQNGHTQDVYQNGKANCFGVWKCEHRHPAIAAMVEFRHITASVPNITHWWTNGSDQIAFGRGDRGFVVINRASTPLTHTLQTGLTPGTYCNILEGGWQRDRQTCTTSPPITVNSQGEATITVNAMDAIALHIGARLP